MRQISWPGKYQEETVRLLNDALKEGLAAGEGIDKLSNRISDIGEFSSDVRADRVATTEAFRVANMAGREAYRQSGVENLVWYTADDGDVCGTLRRASRHGRWHQ